MDRLQNTIAALLTVAGLVVAPLALIAGQSVYQHQLAAATSQAAQRHQVTAVLLRDTAPAVDGRGNSPTTLTPARWQLPDGRIEVGKVDARPGTAAGSTVPIWIDTNGRPTSQPLTAWQAAGQGALVGMGILLVTAVALGGTFNLVRWHLDRRRALDWDAEWAQVGPRWSRHPR